jgi:hypothetical protein
MILTMNIKQYDPRRYRAMRDEIVDSYSERLEFARDVLMACEETVLANEVRQVVIAGGASLSGYADKPDLVSWAIFGAQRFLQHAVEQQFMILGDFDAQKERTLAVAELEYRAWTERFHSWRQSK